MTAGWERVKPQWVRHADGYQVYSDGRDRIAYEDGYGKVVIAEPELTNDAVMPALPSLRQIAVTRPTIHQTVSRSVGSIGTGWTPGGEQR